MTWCTHPQIIFLYREKCQNCQKWQINLIVKDQKLHIPIIIIVRKRLNIPKTINHHLKLNMLIVWLKKSFIDNLMSLNFHNKIIKFTSKNIFILMKIWLKKKRDLKIQPPEKWNYCESFTLQNLLSEHHRLSLRHMDKEMVVHIFKDGKILQLTVGYMSYPGLNQNKTFKDQVF